MIPLRSSEPVKVFPRAALAWILVWIGADVVTRVWPGPRDEFLRSVSFVPAGSPAWTLATALLFHAGWFPLLISAIYAWAFTPRLFERRGLVYAVLVAASGGVLALLGYRAIHPHVEAPVLAPEAILGAWIGASLRKDIWSAMDTWVLGPGWARVFEVPTYVHLFFWLFYLLLGNLLTAGPLNEAPLRYGIAFISILWGFMFDLLWDILGAWMLNSSSREKSGANSSS